MAYEVVEELSGLPRCKLKRPFSSAVCRPSLCRKEDSILSTMEISLRCDLDPLKANSKMDATKHWGQT